MRPRSHSVVFTVLVVALALSPAACGGTGRVAHRHHASAPAPEQFGANVNYLFTYPDHAGADVRAQLATLRATGATLARTDSLWEATEPAAPQGGHHRYTWAFDDLVAAALATAGLRWEPILDYSPAWAESIPGQEHSPPRSDADYAAYAGAFAARYGPGGAFWAAHPSLPRLPVEVYEIWNEPDNPVFWRPRPDPTAYGRLYGSARAAIIAVQPSAQVITGGLSGSVSAFLAPMLQGVPGLAAQIGGVGLHPYGADASAVVAMVATARSQLSALGLGGASIYVTEFGWTTSPPGADQYLPAARRPGAIGAAVAGLAHGYCGVAAVLLYTWVTPQRHRSDPQDWYGISPPDGGGGPGVAAFAAALAAAGGGGGAPAPCS